MKDRQLVNRGGPSIVQLNHARCCCTLPLMSTRHAKRPRPGTADSLSPASGAVGRAACNAPWTRWFF